MEQLHISRLFARLFNDQATVTSEPTAVGSHFFTYLRNPQLRLSALVFTTGALTSQDDVVGIVIFSVSSTFHQLVEVVAAWVDTPQPTLPFASTVQTFCTAMFGSWSVPFDRVAGVTPFALVGRKDAHLHDAVTGKIISDWTVSETGVQTNDGSAHDRVALVRYTGLSVPSLHLVVSKNTDSFKP